MRRHMRMRLLQPARVESCAVGAAALHCCDAPAPGGLLSNAPQRARRGTARHRNRQCSMMPFWRRRGFGKWQRGSMGAEADAVQVARHSHPDCDVTGCTQEAVHASEASTLCAARLPSNNEPSGTPSHTRGSHPHHLNPLPPPKKHARTCACMRFSACWNTTLAGDSMTASTVSRPRSAGRQCMKVHCLPASDIRSLLTWGPRSGAAGAGAGGGEVRDGRRASELPRSRASALRRRGAHPARKQQVAVASSLMLHCAARLALRVPPGGGGRGGGVPGMAQSRASSSPACPSAPWTPTRRCRSRRRP